MTRLRPGACSVCRLPVRFRTAVVTGGTTHKACYIRKRNKKK